MVQILEEDKERLRIMMLAREERPVGRSPYIRSLSLVKDDGIHPFYRKSDEEDSYTPATPVEDHPVGEAIGTFSSPMESTQYTPASPVANQELESSDQDISTFERHTKGNDMNMISKFGYMKGQGLGKHGQGRAKPIKVRERPLNEGLGYIKESTNDNNLVVCCTHC